MISYIDIKKQIPDPKIQKADYFKKIHSAPHSGLTGIHMIPIDSIQPCFVRFRKALDNSSVLRLADSIRKYGFIHPITVRPISKSDNDEVKYEIVIGERRYMAACLLKLCEIPCSIIETDNQKCAELAIIENMQREDLNYLEQAYAISLLISAFRLTQEEAAIRLCVSQSFISNKLRLLKLSDLERYKLLAYSLTERHARALLRLDSPSLRDKAIEHIHKHSLNVDDTEAYIDHLCTDHTPSNNASSKRLILKDIRLFYNTIDKAVSIVKQAGIDIISKRVDDDDGGSTLTIHIPKVLDVSRETPHLNT